MSYIDDHDKTQGAFESIPSVQSRRHAEDVHEALKKELYQQAGVPDPEYIRAVGGFPTGVAPSAGVSAPAATLVPTTAHERDTAGTHSAQKGVIDRYFYLDTDAKDSSSDLPNGLLVYSITTLNQAKPIDNIIEMEIGDFYFPEIPTTASYPTYFFFREMFILIEEMQAQANFAQDNERFHFRVRVQPAGISNLTVDVKSNKFIFSKPFRDLGIATFRFTAPPSFKRVAFQQDIFNYNAVPGAPAGPNFGGAEITTTVPHGLTVGTDVSIFSSGFASDVANIDELINDPDGLLVRVVDATTLEFRAPGTVGFDFTNVLTAVPGVLLVGFRRIAFSMRFRSVTEGETNTITPV